MPSISYQNFSIDKIPDNEAAYFHLLQSVIESVEEFYYLAITRTPSSYKVRISLSDQVYVNSVVEQLNNVNNFMHLKVEYGKSLKKGNLFFSIDIK